MVDGIYVGRRLSYTSARCTVRYVGQVQGTKGEWLGVEWDDPNRGKHNGSHDGVKYFDCQSESAIAASFVRPSRPHDPPLGFLNAFAKKYASEEQAVSLSESEIQISGKVVEEVGFEEIRQRLARLHELRIVLLDGLCVAGVRALPWVSASELHLQEQTRIADQKLKIVELDLSRNLLEKWVDVASICLTLKSLRTLKVNGNRFSDISLPSYVGHAPFQKVEELSLDETLLCWDKILKITSCFPSLTSLSASSNNISTITAPLRNPRLRILTLNSNAFQTLASLTSLSTLTHLTTLSLRSNPLKTVATQPSLLFPNITHLDLTLTLLPDVSSLSPLAWTFPSLTSVLTNKTPLSLLPSSSLFTIARLPTINFLNYSPITPAERQNAELYYLSLIARELSTTTSEEQATQIILKTHPRYKNLCEIYGEPEIATKARAAGSRNTDTEAGTLAARIVKFTFFQMSNNDMIEKQKDIPRTIDIYRLKGIVGRLFGIQRPLGCTLIWETGEWDPVKGEEEEDGGWSCDEDEEYDGEGEEGKGERKVKTEEPEPETKKRGPDPGKENKKEQGQKWTRREIELVDGTHDIGFWIESREARVRVELR